MERLITTTILHLALVAFCIYGMFWGVAKVAGRLEEMLVKAASVQ